MYNEILKNRIEAGLLLSEKLGKYKKSDSIVLAIPRGGVPVAYEIAKSLDLPLDIALSKKIGHPNNKEFAVGAISLDSIIIDRHPEVSSAYIEKETIRLREILKEKNSFYRGNRIPLDIKDKNVIIVDDGIATGNTLLVTIDMLRKSNPKKIIVAVSVLPFGTLKIFLEKADEIVYLIASKNFRAVGAFYEEFDQVSDDEVINMLNKSNTTK
ncbi:phosphoribosyltransferase [Flavobacterium sp. K5-23]|nr:phosphoribosyltransferase [Flavobacterium sp. K5-23]